MSVFKVPFAVAGILMFGGALASELITQASGPVLLHNAAGTKIGSYATMEECIAAAPIAPAPGVKSSCRPVTYVTKVAECDKVAPPFPVKVSPDGFLESPELRVRVLEDGTWSHAEIQQMVPAPWPDCWVIGWVPYTGQDNDGGPPPIADVPSDFWTPSVGPPFVEVPFNGNGPRTEPEAQPSDDPSATSNTDPPVAGQWMALQMP